LDHSSDAEALVLAIAAVGFALTWLAGRGGYVGGPGSFSATWNPQTAMLAAMSVGAAVYYYGPAGGIAIVFSVLWHEWGHVIAYRVAGHDDARFRLIPFFGGVAISDQSPKNHAASCFVTLMGPGFSVSLVAALALAAWWLRETGSPFAREVRWAMVLAGALNAFNMLPLWPLDGGRAIRSITHTVAPGLAHLLTIVMSAILVAIALIQQRWILLFFAVMGYSYAQNAHLHEMSLRPMTGPQALLAAVGYVTILGAHVVAGLPIFIWFLRL